MADNLGDKSRAGLAWDLTGTLLKQILSLVVTIILARLLQPEQFGLVGIALVFVALSQVFIDVGFTDGLIQNKNVSAGTYSTIFYLNLCISLVLAGVIFFVAPWISSFYGNAELTLVIRSLVVTLPIAAAGKVHSAQLFKKMKLKSLALRDIVSAVVGGIGGIIGAVKGMGVYSLVLQQVIVAIVSTVLLWTGTRWIPSLVFSWREVSSTFKFSVFVFYDHLLRELFQRIDTLFIGKFFSPTTLGFYSRAESLNAQIMSYTSSSLRKVIFPVFSALQDDDVRFRHFYLKAFCLAAFLSVTMAGFLFFLADVIIIGLLGSAWGPSVILFQILVFRSITAPFGALMGKALLSRGLSKVKMQVSFIQRVIMLMPMLFGYLYGIEIFATAVVCSYLIGFVVNAWVISRYLSISFVTQIKVFFKPVFPLLILGGGYLFLFPEVNSVVMAFIYLLVQWGFLFFTKDAGYSYFLIELNHAFVKINRVRQKILG